MPPPLLSDIDVALFAVLIPVPLPSALFAMQARERLNPNLYETGKVCLSLLGTWNGKTRHTFETRPLRPKKNPPFFLRSRFIRQRDSEDKTYVAYCMRGGTARRA